MLQHPKQTLDDASLSVNGPPQPAASGSHGPHSGVLCEGWLLKKRRKKLQGYARRYFVLDSNGILSYSFEPGSATRDQISLLTAAISSSPGRKDIHVDSGRVTFHIKSLSKDEFDLWMGALRKFTQTGSEVEKVNLKRSISRGHPSLQAGKLQQASIALDEMSRTIDDLSSICYQSDDDDRKSAASIDRSRTSNSRLKDDKTHSLLSIFKKPTPSNSHQRLSLHRDHSLGASSSAHPSEQLVPLVTKLREQHDALSGLLQRMSPVYTHYRTPVQQVIEEEGRYGQINQQPSWASYRSSMSTVTDSGSVWYDATDGDELGAEEYVVHEEQGDEEPPIVKYSPKVATSSDFVQEDDLSEVEEPERTLSEGENETLKESSSSAVDRRTRLPARPTGDEGSLFAVLKKNVGQDLSNIAFPVTFNEPLTLLQRSAEEMEYYDLLDKAASASDWIERICYVAAFAVSGYACTKFRSGRKGFTPLLGETFEDCRTHFIAEKVVHKPLLIAYHADGQGWELNGASSGKTKFWGKSFEIIPIGVTRVCIGEDEFEWNKPSSFTRNLMMGTKYLEHCGEMVVKNTRSNARCVLDFKETGYWASTPNVVAGSVHSPSGGIASILEGKWDEQMAQKLDSTHLRVLWRITPFPRDTSEYYGYTYFGITLNEITSDIKDKLPCTDSRFRPDVRALEEGDVEGAEREKARVEQMQRERRQNDLEAPPRWFRQIDGTEDWVYAGGYWEARMNGWNNTDIKPLW